MPAAVMMMGTISGEINLLKICRSHLETTKSDGTIKYKNMDDLRRAKQLGAAMLEFFEGVDHIYVEIPVGSQSARAMASYGICVGIIAALGDRVIRISSKDVKLIATNNPKASKQVWQSAIFLSFKKFFAKFKEYCCEVWTAYHHIVHILFSIGLISKAWA